MPYISVTTSLKPSGEQMLRVKSELGRLIGLVPGKTEENLMIDLAASRSMFKAGEAVACAFVEAKLWGKVEAGAKKRFVEEVLAMLRRELGLEERNLFLNLLELDEWGSGGTLKG